MIILFSVLLLLLAYLSYYLKKKVFSPEVLIPLAWGSFLLLYSLFSNLNELSDKVLYVILIWNFFSWLGAYIFGLPISRRQLSQTYNLNDSIQREDINSSIRSVYYYLSIVGTIPLLYIAYKNATTLSNAFLTNLRHADVHNGEMEYQYGIFRYVFTIALVSMLVELFATSNKKCRIIVSIIVNFLLAFITMSKTSFVFMATMITLIAIHKYKISKIKILMVLVMLFFALYGLNEQRSIVKVPLIDYIDIYLFSGTAALDEIVINDMRSLHPGISTFRFVYAVNSKLFKGEMPEKKYNHNITKNGWFFVPLPTNVYTVIGDCWTDFGWFGVIVLGFIIGALSGFFYRQSKQGHSWATITYSWIVTTLALQFFADYIFRNLSILIQIVLLTLLACKFKWVFKWH